ncbi:E3 ubiquitin-protein ligase UBR4 isoform X2 [Hetaerina americana]|uniref:E3 ubiquitin-protein ligase UBR4 isoform X2 n=1 Tax=Hetaerina americana TaxID=62018 RepID=UPI003A7F35BE
MASDSGGVEWASFVKPILAASYGSFNKNDVFELVKAIIKSENEFIKHDPEYEPFYTSFAILAADYISSSSTSIQRSQMGAVCSASRILMRYILGRLKALENANPPGTITGGHTSGSTPPLALASELLLPLRALCSGTSMLSRADQTALTAVMKGARLPAHIRTCPIPPPSSAADKESSTPSQGQGSSSGTKEHHKRANLELSTAITDLLTMPVTDSSCLRQPEMSVGFPVRDDTKQEVDEVDPVVEVKELFIQTNTLSLQSLGGGDVILSVCCTSLPFLARYVVKFTDLITKKVFNLPTSHAEALTVRSCLQLLLEDMTSALNAISIPVLEPLSASRLSRLSVLSSACLYAALTVATAAGILGSPPSQPPPPPPPAASPAPTLSKNTQQQPQGPKEEEVDACEAAIVVRALEVFSLVSTVIGDSPRAGGHILQNHMMIGVWVLLSGLQAQLPPASSEKLGPISSKDDKGKSPSKVREGSGRVNLMKAQQSFGVLSVSLAMQALVMLSVLLEDLRVEEAGKAWPWGMLAPQTGSEEEDSIGTQEEDPRPALLNIVSQCTALSRAVRVLGAAPLNQLLFYLATISYRKACTLKRIQKHPPEGDTFSTSDSTTYYEDDFSCSDESSNDDDDDSEPILGLWFEETLSPTDPPTPSLQPTSNDSLLTSTPHAPQLPVAPQTANKGSGTAAGAEVPGTPSSASSPPSATPGEGVMRATPTTPTKVNEKDRQRLMLNMVPRTLFKDAVGAGSGMSVVPEKGEPHGYISLASRIFSFMNRYLLGSDLAYVRRYVRRGLAEHHMVILAAIIRDLDREMARTERGTISVYFGPTLGVLYTEFSQCLSRYTHNLLLAGGSASASSGRVSGSGSLLPESLRSTLLAHLGISPTQDSISSGPMAQWPLQVYPRTLMVLVQTLLLKSQANREVACINIWNRLIHTLVENICNPATGYDAENEDLNVEHGQVLLFLFHQLNLMQKKSVLLQVALGIVIAGRVVGSSSGGSRRPISTGNEDVDKDKDDEEEVAAASVASITPPQLEGEDQSGAKGIAMKESQLLHLSRLLLLFEYLMRHLYDAPASLFEQVQWNLFSATSLVGGETRPVFASSPEPNDEPSPGSTKSEGKETSGAGAASTSHHHHHHHHHHHRPNPSRVYFPWKELEDAHRKFGGATGGVGGHQHHDHEFSMRPRFYALANPEGQGSPDTIKIDGLACNFLIDSHEKLNYLMLIESLQSILSVTNLCDPALKRSERLRFTGLCSVQYCFTICWRLLTLLPPHATYFSRSMFLNSTSWKFSDLSLILYSLVWGPRTWLKGFPYWITNCLTKQMQAPDDAEVIFKQVSEVLASLTYVSDLVKHCMEHALEGRKSLLSEGVSSEKGKRNAALPSLLSKALLPRLSELALLSAVVARAQHCFAEAAASSSEAGSRPTSSELKRLRGATQSPGESLQQQNHDELARDLLPHVLDLIEWIVACCRSSLLHEALESSEPQLAAEEEGNATPLRRQSNWWGAYEEEVQTYATVLSIRSAVVSGSSSLATALSPLLPTSVRDALEWWNAEKNIAVNADNLPLDQLIINIVTTHVSTLSWDANFSINPSLRHLLHLLVSFVSQLIGIEKECGGTAWPLPCKLQERALQVLLPITLDACTASEAEAASSCIRMLLGEVASLPPTSASANANGTMTPPTAAKSSEPNTEPATQSEMPGNTSSTESDAAGNKTACTGSSLSEEQQWCTYLLVLERIYEIFLKWHLSSLKDNHLSERILQVCLRFMENLLEKTPGRLAIDLFFFPMKSEDDDGDTVENTRCDVKDRKLVKMLLSVTNPGVSRAYCARVIKFFNKMFQQLDKKPGDTSLEKLCQSLADVADTDSQKLQDWLWFMLLGTAGPTAESSAQDIMFPDASSRVPASGTATVAPMESVDVATDDDPTTAEMVNECHQLLQSIVTYFVKENSKVNENVTEKLLSTMIPFGSFMLSPPLEGVGFTQLMSAMITLAGHSSGVGHLKLFKASTEWLNQCKEYLTNVDFAKKMETNGSNACHRAMMESACQLLAYVGDVVEDMCPPRTSSAEALSSPPCEGAEMAQGGGATSTFASSSDFLDLDWVEEMGAEDEESGGEDSDEDSLCGKLCTFTVTAKEFMNQHWYHCHTCRMVDGVGVCTVCAKVCHRGHDLTYAKYGNFFCDCGAKEDASCQALVKRSPQAADHAISSGSSTYSSSVSETPQQVASRTSASSRGVRRASSPLPSTVVTPAGSSGTTANAGQNEGSGAGHLGEKVMDERSSQRQALARQLESCRDGLLAHIKGSSLVRSLLQMVLGLMSGMEASSVRHSPVGCHRRAQEALDALHTFQKKFVPTDSLMVPTLGSQEGAFEHVRMSYSGDQGQTIRQLLSAHMIRRVAMCVLSSPQGKRQHLAVTHEKGKITVLQLSALLKQADSSKRKLTLTRLASAPVPFTVLSITGNPCNEDFLAVCGLKDCHVVTFGGSGSVADHLVLHPGLETGNFIIRAAWLPGSQTELALVTADFVKIYDLSQDALSPQFYFLVPSGKIRDCTFVFPEGGVPHMLLMSSGGHIYSQAMNEESSARHGSFYVTNTIEVHHKDVKDVNGQVCGGGVSVYYSHALRLLFFSYAQGKSFFAPLKCPSDSHLSNVVLINVKSTTTNGNAGVANAGSATNGGSASQNNSGGNSSSNNNGTPTSSNSASSGTKSNSSNSPQPLCQWSEVPNHPGLVCSVMQFSNNPVILMLKPDTVLVQEIKLVPAKAKIMDMVAIRHPSSSSPDHRTTLILMCEDGSLRIYMAGMEQTGYWLSPSVQAANFMMSSRPSRKKKTVKTGKPAGAVTFPVDFFEHCVAMPDVEFGGTDVLQVYNTQQIKHRLNTTGMYIASTRSAGFSLVVTNSDPSMVMTGFRVLLGNQDVLRAPAYVEVFDRSEDTPVMRNRWFDFPFTREESLQADRRFVINFGPSPDPESITMVDSIKVYGKTKEAFGWLEETEEGNGSVQNMTAPVTGGGLTEGEAGLSSSSSSHPLTSLERMTSGVLEVLEGCFMLARGKKDAVKPRSSIPVGDEDAEGGAKEEKEEEVGEEDATNVLPEEDEAARMEALEVATHFLTMPTPPSVQMRAKALLAALHPTRAAYHEYKDGSVLFHVRESFATLMEFADPKDLDAEVFFRLVLMARGVAVARPLNLVSFNGGRREDKSIHEDSDGDWEDETDEKKKAVGEGTSDKQPSTPVEKHFIEKLMDAMWRLHQAQPSNLALAPVCIPGLTHVESVVSGCVEIIHAFIMVDPVYSIPIVARAYMKMLLCPDPAISFTAKHAIVRTLRPRHVSPTQPPPPPPPPQPAQTPRSSQSSAAAGGAQQPPTAMVRKRERRRAGGGGSGSSSSMSSVAFSSSSQGGLGEMDPIVQPTQTDPSVEMDSTFDVDPMVLLPPEAGASGGLGGLNSLEALLGAAAGGGGGGGHHGFPPLLDIPPDADDETMVELAIALSLQDHEGGGGGGSGGGGGGPSSSSSSSDLQHSLQQGLQGLQGLTGLQHISGQALQSLQALIGAPPPPPPLSVGRGIVGGASRHQGGTVHHHPHHIPHHPHLGSGGFVDDPPPPPPPNVAPPSPPPGASDDEGSTAATDGSTLRTSPAEQGGSGAGSDSGGDSITGDQNISGRSSAYDDGAGSHQGAVSGGAGGSSGNRGSVALQQMSSHEEEEGAASGGAGGSRGGSSGAALSGEAKHLRYLRLLLLEKLVCYIPRLKKVGGLRSIPFMQVILMLTCDLDGEEERDRKAAESLLNALVLELQIGQLDSKVEAGKKIDGTEETASSSQPQEQVLDIAVRTPQREVQLIIIRLLSVLMSRTKSSYKGTGNGDNSGFVASITASTLIQAGVVDHCLQLLKALLQHWKSSSVEEQTPVSSSAPGASGGGVSAASVSVSSGGTAASGSLLRPHHPSSLPDMSPFFMRQYVRGCAGGDVFTAYPQLLTEMTLRLPYQVHKHHGHHHHHHHHHKHHRGQTPPPQQQSMQGFDQEWHFYLCEYMMTQQTPFVRRQVRKLLLFICGNKDKYRQLRDLHALQSHMRAVQQFCAQGGLSPSAILDESLLEDMAEMCPGSVWAPHHSISLPYDALVELTEHLRACLEVAQSRTGNWQRFCLREGGLQGIGIDGQSVPVLLFLLHAACMLDDGVSPSVLQLLQYAICGSGGCGVIQTSSSNTKTYASAASGSATKAPSTAEGSAGNAWEVGEEEGAAGARWEEAQCSALVQQLNRRVPQALLSRFVRTFLLETNATSVRWQAHALVLGIYKNSTQQDQEALLDLLWSLWPQLPAYGRKAAQFVDLLGYFSLKTSQTAKKMGQWVEQAVGVLHAQNRALSLHPNASLYTQLATLVDLDGYYLESEPCLVCNNPEVPFAPIKLSSIKIDSKFTTTTQIVKLVGSHTISKITLRVGDLKRTKMVRTLIIYYNNRSVQGVVELKNKPAMWHKAKKVTLSSGQTEVKMEFPLPIVACNLMMEYSDFYESIQASSEILQCPRCSASVPANPGVCTNCGENVFQCHKCRAINYDEKDPFLCHACGFCKYAKFEYSLTGRPTCAVVDPVESDEDRKRTVATVNSLLEKADRIYRQLVANKPTLEMLLLRISEHRSDRGIDGDVVGGGAGSNSGTLQAAGGSAGATAGVTQVNRSIHLLAQRYCGECRISFEELSKIIQRVLACRRELVAYDRNQRDLHMGRGSVGAGSRTPSAAGGPTCVSEDTPSAGSATVTAPVKPGGRCYGCAISATEHCLTLLRALASEPKAREVLCSKGLVTELVENNLRRGSVQVQEEVRQLLCLLTRDNPIATEELQLLLMERISVALIRRPPTRLSPTPSTASTPDIVTEVGDDAAPSLAPPTADLPLAVRHEMALLAALVQMEDSCWEQKLRCVMQLFLLACKDSRSPVVMESIILPCLKILQGVINLNPIAIPPSTEAVPSQQPTTSSGKKGREKTPESPPPTVGVQPAQLVCSVKPAEEGVVRVDLGRWLAGDPEHSSAAWRARVPSIPDQQKQQKPLTKEEARALYLREKYVKRLYVKVLMRRSKGNLSQANLGPIPLRLTHSAWLRRVLFNPSSRLARQVACSLVESLCLVPGKKREVLDLLTEFLGELGTAGESAAEFLSLYQSLIGELPWRHYLAVRGLLPRLAFLLTVEIRYLHRLEETTLTSDLAQGYALKMLTELLASFMESESIKRALKGRLVGAVLDGYLSLRRLVVQRTRLIDDTQEKLLELLEEMTTGTEAETRAFMAICVETAGRCALDDVRTPVFVFERLCSIIYPEENDIGEFFLTLEKDPQQEDFLQGRMLGNPYSSTEAGLGPLMRDVKNKICVDCELVALLEDDNGMELLVNNKIISLDLPVREVFKKVWLGEGGEGEVMRVVYRMRGLLGDATEEFVETLDAQTEATLDNEEVYRMANVMAECGGLQVMLERLAAIKDVTRSRPLLQVLLKLFLLCVKVKRNQELLTQPELGAIGVFLGVLQLCLSAESIDGMGASSGSTAAPSSTSASTAGPAGASLSEQLLDIMDTVLSKAASQPLDSFLRFSRTFGGPEYIPALLSCAAGTAQRLSSSVAAVGGAAPGGGTGSSHHHLQVLLPRLARVVAALTYGNPEKMALLASHFDPSLNFERLDRERPPEDEQRLELFCTLASGIERNAIGNTLKDYLVSLGVVALALDYIQAHAANTSMARTDSEEWKEFISRPALKYILRFLTGLTMDHEPTQLAVSAEVIPVIHRLEQVSSDEHVGSLAENLLEAIKGHGGEVAQRVDEVRENTRAEKKRLAMAVRERQLGALGMRTNDKGQVTAASGLLAQQMEDLGEETGPVCVICREGYKFQPTKVLGVYTFTKRCPVEEFETVGSGSASSAPGGVSSKSRRTFGYSTVTHFNVVHVDCHMAAVRLARARDEWESAALQNANTKCNGLLPLWGPQVPESAFASCLARHNTYLQECTGHRDISYSSTVHDLKLLLLRFSQERAFHEDTGGGGPQSNMHLVPYLIHMALYVINTTRSGPREEKALTTYLDNSVPDRWLDSSFEADGPLYYAALSPLLHSGQRWAQGTKLSHLRRLLVCAHARHTDVGSGASGRLADATPKDYAIYKPYLVFFGLVDGIYNHFFKKVNASGDEQWPSVLADYIRHNDESLLKASESLLAVYREELLTCASFSEFCDVAGLLGDISNPETYLVDLFQGLT